MVSEHSGTRAASNRTGASSPTPQLGPEEASARGWDGAIQTPVASTSSLCRRQRVSDRVTRGERTTTKSFSGESVTSPHSGPARLCRAQRPPGERRASFSSSSAITPLSGPATWYHALLLLLFGDFTSLETGKVGYTFLDQQCVTHTFVSRTATTGRRQASFSYSSATSPTRDRQGFVTHSLSSSSATSPHSGPARSVIHFWTKKVSRTLLCHAQRPP